MKSKLLKKKIRKLEGKLVRQREHLAKLKRKLEPQEVGDFELSTTAGAVRLADLFQGKRDLIVVHNMGRSCPYCTLWADGYNGLVTHLEDRAAFVVVSPDTPAQQKAFAAKRGWEFKMVSDHSGNFTKQMGFKKKDDWFPGVSTFQKRGQKVYHVASAPFGPFDVFCAAWHFFALLAGGEGTWSPKFSY